MAEENNVIQSAIQGALASYGNSQLQVTDLRPAIKKDMQQVDVATKAITNAISNLQLAGDRQAEAAKDTIGYIDQQLGMSDTIQKMNTDVARANLEHDIEVRQQTDKRVAELRSLQDMTTENLMRAQESYQDALNRHQGRNPDGTPMTGAKRFFNRLFVAIHNSDLQTAERRLFGHMQNAAMVDGLYDNAISTAKQHMDLVSVGELNAALIHNEASQAYQMLAQNRQLAADKLTYLGQLTGVKAAELDGIIKRHSANISNANLALQAIQLDVMNASIRSANYSQQKQEEKVANFEAMIRETYKARGAPALEEHKVTELANLLASGRREEVESALVAMGPAAATFYAVFGGRNADMYGSTQPLGDAYLTEYGKDSTLPNSMRGRQETDALMLTDDFQRRVRDYARVHGIDFETVKPDERAEIQRQVLNMYTKEDLLELGIVGGADKVGMALTVTDISQLPASQLPSSIRTAVVASIPEGLARGTNESVSDIAKDVASLVENLVKFAKFTTDEKGNFVPATPEQVKQNLADIDVFMAEGLPKLLQDAGGTAVLRNLPGLTATGKASSDASTVRGTYTVRGSGLFSKPTVRSNVELFNPFTIRMLYRDTLQAFQTDLLQPARRFEDMAAAGGVGVGGLGGQYLTAPREARALQEAQRKLLQPVTVPNLVSP